MNCAQEPAASVSLIEKREWGKWERLRVHGPSSRDGDAHWLPPSPETEEKSTVRLHQQLAAEEREEGK